MTTLAYDSDIKAIFNQSFSYEHKRLFNEGSNWKLLGQEYDNSLLISWKATLKANPNEIKTFIGVFKKDTNIFVILHICNEPDQIVQASVNASRTLLLYSTKTTDSDKTDRYKLRIVSISKAVVFNQFSIESTHQIMANFLYPKISCSDSDRFLVFIHQDCIAMYRVIYSQSTADSNEDIKKHASSELVETVVKAFSWAQWNVFHQSLFYIHYKKPVHVEPDSTVENAQLPTLSALQFNDSVPHETVLNIPLNLPLPVIETSCNTYDDIPIPLRVHDCALDVTVLCDDRGLVCICHHYLYQPVSAPNENVNLTESTTVHLAYSVTLLHHGLVVHCTLPGIPWTQANDLKPVFALHNDDYLLVYMPGLFVHLLDLGPYHEPCCHILVNQEVPNSNRWLPLKQSDKGISLVALDSLKVFNLDISPKLLLETYFNETLGLPNKLSIIHYFLVHRQDFDIIGELLKDVASDCLRNTTQEIFHEILVGGAYASVSKSFPTDGFKLMKFLPLSSVNKFASMEVKMNGKTMTLTQEALWNPAVMLLSPRQRLCQFRTDLWTKLWDLIADTSCISRFKPTIVAEKLMPEALSRCSTPLSPSGGLSINITLAEMNSAGNYRIKPLLPFYEIEKCTASKQEHVISVNMRELSIHLVKHGLENPLQVHVVATRYAAAQLEMSRFLCSLVSSAVGVSGQHVKGFQLINDLGRLKRKMLFFVLERYSLAVDYLAYPTPQGFSSFFTYLAYKSLDFDHFFQYVQANALQMQIDVMKMILPEISNLPLFQEPQFIIVLLLCSKTGHGLGITKNIKERHKKEEILGATVSELERSNEGALKKLKLLLLLPRSRARRLLNQWAHPLSLMLRAREHANNILSGLEARTLRHKSVASTGVLRTTMSSVTDLTGALTHFLFSHYQRFSGLAVFHSSERYSPLDTFLDLLTAKASLAELDFNLLVEATMTPIENY